MGCFCSCICKKNGNTSTVAGEDEPKKQYSWEMNRGLVDPKDFTVEKLKDEIVIRKPGTINGQQFIIQDCEDCHIFLLDHTNVVTIDDCRNCAIVIGPTRGSVFIRNCDSVRLVTACQQFRARDCLKLRVSLLCSSQPSIEFCTGLKFSCIQLNYTGFKEQLEAAQLNPFTNFWYEIYDFTPSQVVHNWSYSKGYTRVFEDIEHEDLNDLNITEEPEESAVPRVHGTRKCSPSTHDRVLIFNGKECEEKAFKCLKTLTEQGHHLVRTRKIEKNQCSGLEWDSLFGDELNNRDSSHGVRGPLVVLQFTGGELPHGYAQQNNLHTSCDHKVIATLFTTNMPQ